MEHFDIIVIGSGAGGGTVVHELASTGRRIFFLERGDYLQREKQNWSSESVWGDLRYRNSERWTDAGKGTQFLPKQHYYVGGNTKFYGAVLFRMRADDFGSVQHVDGISPAWPISYGDLEPFYTRAERLYCVHGEHGVDPWDPPASAQYPSPPVSDEPRIAQLREDLTAHGLHPFSLPLGVMLDEASPSTSACIRCDTCDGYPCLANAKADAQVVCVDPALRFPNVQMRTNTKAIHLITSSDGRRVDQVVCERDGIEERYQADLVVVSAGAINSAALLLRSADERHPNGLGNSSGVVGRHLMLHNNSTLIAISKTPNPSKFQKTLGVNDFYYGDPFDSDWKYPLGAMQMLGKSDAFTMSLDAPDSDDPAALARHSLDLWLTTEDLPLWENQVRADADGGITLHHGPSNLSAHQRLVARWREMLDHLGCHGEAFDRPTYLGGKLGLNGVSHQNGTVRFGHDPASSALDVNCRLHDVDNCYVVDASFFPSSSAVNPTLTIVANALRVSDHLTARLAGKDL